MYPDDFIYPCEICGDTLIQYVLDYRDSILPRACVCRECLMLLTIVTGGGTGTKIEEVVKDGSYLYALRTGEGTIDWRAVDPIRGTDWRIYVRDRLKDAGLSKYFYKE